MNIQSSKSMQDADNETAYLMLKIAMERFQCPHSDLQKEQQVEVLSQAHKMQHLNQTILSSSQAQTVEVSEFEVEKTLQQIMQRYEKKEDFEHSLKEQDLSISSFRNLLANELRVSAVLEKVSEAAVVSDAEIQDYYNTHQKSFFQPEMRKVRHILITVNDEFEGNSYLDSQLSLILIAKEIGKSLEKFEHFALKKSECPSALHGGLIGTVPKGKLFPELDEVLFTMSENSLSEPIKTEMGFHLVWCESISPEKLIPLHEVEQKVRTHIQDKKRTTYQQQWIAKEMQKQKVSRVANH